MRANRTTARYGLARNRLAKLGFDPAKENVDGLKLLLEADPIDRENDDANDDLERRKDRYQQLFLRSLLQLYPEWRGPQALA